MEFVTSLTKRAREMADLSLRRSNLERPTADPPEAEIAIDLELLDAHKAKLEEMGPPGDASATLHHAVGQAEGGAIPAFGAEAVDNVQDFSVVTAVGCAKLAFDAYRDPVAIDYPNVMQVHSNGCQVFFAEREFFAMNFSHILSVSVESAADLIAADTFSKKNDAYVKLRVGDSTAETGVAEKSLTPVWSDFYSLYVAHDASELVIEVLDKDSLSADDLLGTAVVPLTGLPSEEHSEITVPLQQPDGSEKGTLVLSARLLAVTADTADDVLQEAYNFTLRSPGVKREVFEPMDETGIIPEQVKEHDEELSIASPVPGSKESEEDTRTKVMIWRSLLHRVGLNVYGLVKPLTFISCPATHTEAWVSCNRATKSVVVAFRGTQGAVQDVLSDINIIPVELTEDRKGGSLVYKFIPSDRVFVHAGFLRGYDSVRKVIFDHVDAIVGGDPDWTVYCTGHSLGAALCTLCAYELGSAPIVNGNNLVCYTFGSPRVGNDDFAKAFSEKVPVSWRVTNELDIVTGVPSLMGWRHVDHVAKLDRFGNLDLPGEQDDPLNEPGWFDKLRGSVSSHFRRQYLVSLEAHVVTQILAKEAAKGKPSVTAS